jgi:hypothetical protein
MYFRYSGILAMNNSLVYFTVLCITHLNDQIFTNLDIHILLFDFINTKHIFKLTALKNALLRRI